MESESKEEDCEDSSMIFDAVGIHFYIDVFISQLFQQLLYPLALVFAFNRKQDRFGKELSKTEIIEGLVFTALFYLMTATEFLSEDNYGLHSIPTMFFLQSVFIVSVNYASLSKTEYLRFRHCTDFKLCRKWYRQMHLLTGWLRIDEAVIKFELSCAAARIGAQIHEIDFLIEGANAARTHPPLQVDEQKDGSHAASRRSTAGASTEAIFENRLFLWNAFLRVNENVDSTTPLTPVLRCTSCSDSTGIGGGSGDDGEIGCAGKKYTRDRASRRMSLKSIKHITLYRLSVYDFCAALLRRPFRYRNVERQTVERAIQIFATINLLLPFLSLVITRGERFERQSATMIFLICLLYASASVVGYRYGVIFYRLLYTAVADVSRLQFMLHDLNAMIRTSDLMEDPKIGLPRMKSRNQKKRSMTGAILVANKRVSLLRQIRSSVTYETQPRSADEVSETDGAQVTPVVVVASSAAGGSSAAGPQSALPLSDYPDLYPAGSNMLPLTSENPMIYRASTGYDNYVPRLRVENDDDANARVASPSSVVKEAEGVFDALLRISNIYTHSPLHHNPTTDPPTDCGEDCERDAHVSNAHSNGKKSATVAAAAVSKREKLQRAKSAVNLFGETSWLGSCSDEPIIPPLSFRYAQNIVAWSYARETILNFGLRFRTRINIFLGTQSIIDSCYSNIDLNAFCFE